MEEMSPAVSLTLSLSNPVCDNSGIANHVEITRLKLVTETASLLSDPESLLPEESVCSSDETGENSDLPETMPKSESSSIASDALIQESEEDGVFTVGNDPNGIVVEEMLPMDASSEISLPISVESEKIETDQLVSLPSIDQKSAIDLLSVVTSPHEIERGQISRGGIKSVFELDCVPLWGYVSICGKRPEMEDSVVAVPWFMKIPIQMFVGDDVINGLSQRVANYCRDRMHFALGEELKDLEPKLVEGSMMDTQQAEWERVFTRCFMKVDDEVGGKVNRDVASDNADASGGSVDPVAPETVGSTAVVALISSSHIIVANCGDSRAVLYRGKEPMALSIDHKPNREDEYARIEASGGKVIQWNGHRVLGVLAMSRSIGDRYLKPWIIPEPEVMFIPRTREDECLILASDGLWDVMTNNEACEAARRRILLWHKKNGDVPLVGRGQGIDPAAQAAAEYLLMLALQKGSKDNISIIVVDLKAQRKFKSKS
ncbi:hypothetical protein TEA_029826 [Camellia sinensis var. sinensis]|uniref:PPM-type phosphatase domain-containing protein n=1 Tax=Camellia sinensis var. sinensis TaxID=542762 RepID=A0A4S4D3J1_CAMSN|nr:hypothetical protein TEA_029826 [Camellia sinensis var. sinensis]